MARRRGRSTWSLDDREMSDQRPRSRLDRLRVKAFRLAAAILLFFSVVALASVAVGAYFVVAEFDQSGWFGVLTVVLAGIVSSLLCVVCWRAVRIRSVEELDEQNRSRTLQRVGKWLGV